jgi:H+/Cl- antiporter ClcA
MQLFGFSAQSTPASAAHTDHMSKQSIFRLSLVSAVLGVLIGLGATLFIRAIQLGSGLVWGGLVGSVHSAPWAVIAVSAVGGLLMGLCVKYFGTNDDGIGFDAVIAAVKQDGELGVKQIKRVVLNTYAGLITGASLGPESPLITICGFAGDWLARRLKATKQQLMAFISIALGGGIGVLVDSPVAGPILFAEQPPAKDPQANTVLIFTTMIAASIGFAAYFFLGSPLLAGKHLVPGYTNFHAVDLLYALAIGLAGTLFGHLFRYLILIVRKFSHRWISRPVLKGLAVGVVIGLCATITPLVRFDGSAQLSELVAHASQYSILALIGLALLRLLSTSVALGGGYQGGNIFPSIFISGALGLAVHALLPFVPAPVAMVAFMASVMYVFTPLPLFVIFLFTEISSFSLIPVMAMSLVGGYLFQIWRQPSRS